MNMKTMKHYVLALVALFSVTTASFAQTSKVAHSTDQGIKGKDRLGDEGVTRPGGNP